MTTLEMKPIALRFSPLSSTPPGVAAAGAAAVAPSMERGAYGMEPRGVDTGVRPSQRADGERVRRGRPDRRQRTHRARVGLPARPEYSPGGMRLGRRGRGRPRRSRRHALRRRRRHGQRDRPRPGRRRRPPRRPSVDRLEGGAGNDRLDGAGSGDDLIGGAGTDTADYSARTLGGDGRDKVDYSDRTSPLTITLDGVANDGAPGENDVLDSIQDIDGGQGSDTLVGNGNANAIFGAQGDDVLRGLGGDDNLTGTAGADVLDGGSGAEDSVSYGGSFEGVVVTLDGVANDGASFERDQVDPSVGSGRGRRARRQAGLLSETIRPSTNPSPCTI